MFRDLYYKLSPPSFIKSSYSTCLKLNNQLNKTLCDWPLYAIYKSQESEKKNVKKIPKKLSLALSKMQ